MACSTLRTSGCTRPRARGEIAWSAPLQLSDQAIDSPRECGQIPLGEVAAEVTSPGFVSRPQFLHQRAPAPGELHARRAEIIRIIAPLGQPELFQPQDHPRHVLLRYQ